MRKILNLTIASVFAVSNTLYAAEVKQSVLRAKQPALRSISTANMLSTPWFSAPEKAKGPLAGRYAGPAERLNLFKEAIADYQSPQDFRISIEIDGFLEWVETEATLADIKGLIDIMSQKGFRLVQQTEQEQERSSAEVDFRKNSDQEEAALLSRFIYKAMHNINSPKYLAKNFILKKQKEKNISNLFKIAVELAKSKAAVDNIKRPLKVAFHFAIWTCKDRMSRQSEHINGEDSLRRKILQLEDLFGDNPLVDWQLIAIDDGSPNNSGEFAENILRNEYPDYYFSGKTKVLYMEDVIKENVRHPILRGLRTTDDTQKGGSLEWGMYVSIMEGADILIYTDTDISSHLGLAGNLLRYIENDEADVVIGSRAMSDSLVLNRPFMRRIRSWQDTEAYSRLVTRPLLPSISDIRDTQNSFKAFRREVLTHILPFTIDKKLSFDTELLVLARGAGYRIKEIGMPWVDTPARTTVKMTDGLKMAKRIFAQRERLKAGAYNLEESRRYERLTLKGEEGEKTFLIISPLYKDENLLLAEDEATGELFVIEKSVNKDRPAIRKLSGELANRRTIETLINQAA